MKLEEDLLREVLRVLPIPQHAGQQVQDLVLVPEDEVLKGVLVPREGSLDEL
jgi:hypothetical protein